MCRKIISGGIGERPLCNVVDLTIFVEMKLDIFTNSMVSNK